MAFRIIVEGVTGAGKSETVAALLDPNREGGFPEGTVLFDESETFGQFMNEELPRTDLSAAEKVHRLGRLLARIEALAPDVPIVLERFHPSYFALLPDWDLYDALDEALERAGFRMAHLEIPESSIRERSLDRPDREGWAEGMIGYYGSEQQAIRAIAHAQSQRRACMGFTRLSTVRLNTSAMAWTAYARTIARFAGS